MSLNMEEHTLDISKLLSAELRSIPFSVSVSEEMEQNGIAVSEVNFSGEVYGEPSLIMIDGKISCTLNSECARCLRPVISPFSVEISLPVLREELSDDADDFVPLVDDKIDLFSIVYEKLIPEIPFRLLCNENCKGFCSKCGKDLNTGECDCSDKEIDPRLQGLSDFFK